MKNFGNLTIRSRFILTYIGLVLLTLTLLLFYLHIHLKKALDQRITSVLKQQSRIVGESLSIQIRRPFTYSEIDEIIDRLGEEIETRLTFIGTNGTVWGDTDLDGDDLRTIENHTSRPEVISAMRSGEGIADRHSTTLKMGLRYHALAVRQNGDMIGICRTALPLKVINQNFHKFQQKIIFAGVIFLVVVSVLGAITAEALTRPISKLQKGLQQITDGDYASRVSIRGGGEFEQLAQHFNQMASQIQNQISPVSHDRLHLEKILTNMIEGTLLLNQLFEITYANRQAIVIFGLPENHVGLPLFELCPHAQLQQILNRARDGNEIISGELSIQFAVPYETEITIIPTISEKQVQEFVVAIHDISQIKRLERMREDFVANVSHELRTPLTSIQGYAETLISPIDDEEIRFRFASKIYRQATLLSQLVSDLLDLSQIESGKIEIDLVTIRLSELRESIFEMFEPVLSETEIKFIWDIPIDLPLIQADRWMLLHALANLIDNAIKYTQIKGVVTVSAEVTKNEVIVQVSDTGIGIPESALERIFERFYCVDKARSREVGGTGLGLSITKYILLQHGGKIWAESKGEIGEGSSFFFTLKKVKSEKLKSEI